MNAKKIFPAAPIIGLGMAMAWSACNYPAEKAISQLEKSCEMTTDLNCAVEVTLDQKLTVSEINYVGSVLKNTTACRLSTYQDETTKEKVYFVERKNCDTASVYPHLLKGYNNINSEICK